MNHQELVKLNKLFSQQKKKTFQYLDRFVVRTEYGTKEAKICCGMMCKFCVYEPKHCKGSTEIKRNLDW